MPLDSIVLQPADPTDIIIIPIPKIKFMPFLLNILPPADYLKVIIPELSNSFFPKLFILLIVFVVILSKNLIVKINTLFCKHFWV